MATTHLRLAPAELAEAGQSITRDLPLDLVDPNPANPRKALTEVADLAENIKRFGLLQPVTVRRAGERFELLGGHRRRAAFLLLREAEPLEPRWRVIPAVVRTADDSDARLMLISGQVHNRAWSSREEASILEDLASTMTLAAVGALVNKSKQWVGSRLKIYADAVLSGFVQSGALSTTVAQELLAVTDPKQRLKFAELAVTEEWTPAHARAEARKLKIDAQARQAGRLTRDLLEILSATDPAKLPIEVTRDLWVLAGRIQVMGRGGPIIPTMEQAPGVKPARQRRTRLRTE